MNIEIEQCSFTSQNSILIKFTLSTNASCHGYKRFSLFITLIRLYCFYILFIVEDQNIEPFELVSLKKLTIIIWCFWMIKYSLLFLCRIVSFLDVIDSICSLSFWCGMQNFYRWYVCGLCFYVIEQKHWENSGQFKSLS